MGTEKRRKIIVKSIMQTVIKATSSDKCISRKVLESEIALDEGVTRRKAAEYIDLLLDARRLVEVEGDLILPPQAENQEAGD